MIVVSGEGERGGSGDEAKHRYGGENVGAVAREKVNIQNISTSEIRISCIVAKEDGEKALRAVHAAFELEKS